MKTIFEILKMTPDEYDMLVMNWWTTYCYDKAQDKVQVQKLLNNNVLFQWWHAQLEMVEPEFVADAHPYEDSYTQDDATKLYAFHAYRIQKFYNSDLIKEALQ